MRLCHLFSMFALVSSLACAGGKRGPNAPVRSSAKEDDLDHAIDQLAEQILLRLTESAKTKVGINEFLTLKGETNDLGKFLSEELTTRVINSRKTQVVERRLLQKVLAEQEIGASQLVDDETAARIGKLLGADTLCTGTLTDLGTEIKVNARLINAETAEVYGAASIDLPKNRAVMALLGGSGTVRPAFTTGPAPERKNNNNRPATTTPAQTTQETPARPAISVGPAKREPTPVAKASAEPTPAVQPAHANEEPVIFLGKPGDGPDELTIHNKTKYCVRVWMNGKLLKIVDKTVEVPCIPDRERSHVRIGAFGEYRIQASGSSTPQPFKGIVAYDRHHTLSPQQKRLVVVFDINDFYTVN